MLEYLFSAAVLTSMFSYVSKRISVPASAVVAGVGVAALTACSEPGLPFVNRLPKDAERALENVDSLELLGLDPSLAAAEDGTESFHGWKVLRRQRINDPATRDKLIAAFKRGVDENRGTQAMCFNPRHGLRIVSAGKTHDFVICFECLQVYSYDGRGLEIFLISESPRSVFNEATRALDPPGGTQRDCFAACEPLLKSRPAAWNACTDECWAKWRAERGAPSSPTMAAEEDSR